MAQGIKLEEARHRIRMRQIEQQGRLYEMKQEEKELRKSFRKQRKRLSTSKAGLWYMLIMCTMIQIYAMVAMWVFRDLSPLTALIGATVGEVFTYLGYTFKASGENRKGGITYEMAMREPTEGQG